LTLPPKLAYLHPRLGAGARASFKRIDLLARHAAGKASRVEHLFGSLLGRGPRQSPSL